MEKLTKLPNIGKVVASELIDTGIRTPEELRKIGSKEAFIRLKIKYNDSCLCKLYALEGAVEGIRWHNLSDEVKIALKQFYSSLDI